MNTQSNNQPNNNNNPTNPTKPTTPFNGMEFIKECGTKSSAIRKLDAQKYSRGEISKMLNIRYQHVRNVLITPIKKEMVRK